MPLAEFQHTTLQHQVGDMNMPHRACHFCAWVSEQETLQVKKLRRQLYNPMLQVQLCLPHARAVLRQFRDDLTQQAVALALLRSVSQVGKRVEGYVYKCTERFQDQINRTNESLGLTPSVGLGIVRAHNFF